MSVITAIPAICSTREPSRRRSRISLRTHMRVIRTALLVLLMPFALAACQNSQSAISTHAGSSLKADPVKRAKLRSTKKRVIKNEAASLVVKPEDKKRAKKRVVKNEAASLVVTKKNIAAKNAKKKTKKTSLAKRKAKTVNKKFALLKRSSTVKKSTKRRASKTRNAGNKSRYQGIIARYARENGVPLKLAMAVVQVESNYRASARGGAGEVGLMQIKPRTARGIGYKGSTKNLYNPETNIRYGMKYLGKAYKLGGGTTCGAILKYNAGHGAKRMNPISRKYCKKVQRIMGRG